MTLAMARMTLIVMGGLVLNMPTHADPVAAAWSLHSEVRGQVEVSDGELQVTGDAASLVLGDSAMTDYQVSVQVKLAPGDGPWSLMALPTDIADGASPAAVRLHVAPVGQSGGLALTNSTHDGQRWRAEKERGLRLNFMPADAAANKRVEADGLAGRPWHEHWIEFRFQVSRRTVRIWAQGLLVVEKELDSSAQGAVVLGLRKGDRARPPVFESWTADDRFLPVDITHQARGHDVQELSAGPGQRVEVGGIPFVLGRDPFGSMDLSKARWIDQDRDPWSFQEPYDGGPDLLHDPRMPMLRVPAADYIAAHVLAVAQDKPGHTQAFTLRAGRFGLRDQVYCLDFPGRANRTDDPDAGASWTSTPSGRMQAVRVPMSAAFAQDVRDYIEIELTREVRLARRHPDPNRFRYRPVGMPSSVRIAAVTLERSPLAMRVTSSETGHAFVEPQSPLFQVHLRNVTTREQAYSLRIEGEHLTGQPFPAVHHQGTVEAGQSVVIDMKPVPSLRGYHELRVVLSDGDGCELLTRRTSFAVLPPDTRQHRDTSPFGMWDFGPGHFGVNDVAIVGPLYVKLGMRYGMFTYTPQERAQWGVRQGQDYAARMKKAKGATPLDGFMAHRERHPDATSLLMLFHEDYISRDHVTRTVDWVHDYPPYQLNDEEKLRLDDMVKMAVGAAQAVRKEVPEVHVTLGNGAIATREELYRQGFPADQFDSAGNESASYGRLPEAQPPDSGAMNASVWLDRQLLDHYGYTQKPVTLAYEVCVPGTNPGNLTPRTQADYFVRHALHMLAWRMPLIRVGVVHDVGNSYRFSNWGTAGFTRMAPELNVKPSFVAFANMTRLLDGATFRQVIPTSSQSVYVLQFDRADGKTVLALWTIRGKRAATLTFNTNAPRTLIDSQGQERTFESQAIVHAEIGPSPVYIVGDDDSPSVQLGEPIHQEAPRGEARVLDRLASLEGWTIETQSDPVLEFYNPLSPRRQGDFSFQIVSEFEGRAGVLRVEPRPIARGKPTMPMYMAMRHEKGIAVSGRPTQVGVWVNGNSGWGRLSFEFTDATGQRWTSIGAPTKELPPRWLEQRATPQQIAALGTSPISDWNTDDAYGHARINFDGWRYLAIDLPGHYPGDGYRWPANSQWRHDRDGIVHYPITLRRVIVELTQNVLHVYDYQPVRRPEIYLADLTVAQQNNDQPKRTPWEW